MAKGPHGGLDQNFGDTLMQPIANGALPTNSTVEPNIENRVEQPLWSAKAKVDVANVTATKSASEDSPRPEIGLKDAIDSNLPGNQTRTD